VGTRATRDNLSLRLTEERGGACAGPPFSMTAAIRCALISRAPTYVTNTFRRGESLWQLKKSVG
jgi:hypothetical protein